MKLGPGTLLLASLALALGACANAQDSGETSSAQETPRTCMLVRNIDTYHPIDRHHVVISDQGERTFLLGTFRPGCWDIMRSASIALETAPISLCEGQTATLMVSGERCYIRTLEAVESLEVGHALAEERADESE